MDENQQYFEAIKHHWDVRAKYHVESKFYDVASFKQGATTLQAIELAELPSLKGKKLLHLQCHFGMDSISLARKGADVTAIDLSSESIEEAKKLSKELDVDVNFIECNVLEIDQVLDGQEYDVIFTSYGVLCWLPKLDGWAQQIYKHLKPGGMFYIAEFHPVLWIFDENTKSIAYSYFNQKDPYKEVVTETYGEQHSQVETTEYFWSHSLNDIFSALINEGLRIDSFKEYDYSPFKCFDTLEERKKGEYMLKINNISMPCIFSMQCSKPL